MQKGENSRVKAAIYTLGCKVNQFESQAVEQELRRRGFEMTDFDSPADVYIVNSCTVTAMSDKKSRQMLSHVRRLHPEALAVLCGCYAQVDESTDRLDADLIMGTGNRMELVDRIEELLRVRTRTVVRDDARGHRTFEPLPGGSVDGRTRALLKVQDGCSNFCTYCIIPYARGPVRSMPLVRAREEARRLAERGFLEVVLTGIELSSYGKDLPEGEGLGELIEAVSQAAPGLRLRLGSLEPRTVTESFCAGLSASQNLCPHFHLSLQSGCDATLRRMKRRYSTARFLESVELLNRYFPGCAVTTDLIVGFPGETEEEFEETCRFLEACQFADMHIFPYSPRRGTPAASFPGQLTNRVKQDRASRAAQVAERLRTQYRQGLKGRTLQVLFEQEEDGACRGHGENYVPVQVVGTGLRGRVCPVEITGLQGEILMGCLAKTIEK